jgi:hypothetical protein
MERRSRSSYDVCFQARIAEERNAMKQFIEKFADRIDGVLCGFDRLVMRGELRALYIANGGGIEQHWRSSHVMFQDFRQHVPEVSRRLKEASLAAVLELGRGVRYVPSAAASKEDLGNSLKAYDKAYTPVGSILRLEPTINEGAPFRSYRPQRRRSGRAAGKAGDEARRSRSAPARGNLAQGGRTIGGRIGQRR